MRRHGKASIASLIVALAASIVGLAGVGAPSAAAATNPCKIVVITTDVQYTVCVENYGHTSASLVDVRGSFSGIPTQVTLSLYLNGTKVQSKTASKPVTTWEADFGSHYVYQYAKVCTSNLEWAGSICSPSIYLT